MTENASLKNFIDRLLRDSKLTEEFKKVASEGSPEKTYQFALENSDGGFTKEEFENAISELTAVYEYAKEKLLDDTVLDEVAGGAVDLDSEEFWKKALDIDETGQSKSDKDAGAIVTDIYSKELELAQKENKGNLIAKGVGAGKHAVDLVTTIGNIVLSWKDKDIKQKKYDAMALDRELEHYQILLKKQELLDNAKAQGINLVP